MRTAIPVTESLEVGSGPGARVERTIGNKLGLPGTRAVVGGLLVALAAILLAFGARDTEADSQTKFLVVTNDVDAGTKIGAKDLALAPMDLFEDTASGVHTDPDEVIGKVALTPIKTGGLVTKAGVAVSPDEIGPQRSVALNLKPDQALNGSLRTGDRVDVVGLDESGASVLIKSAIISDVATPESQSLGATDSVSITISVPTAEDATKLISAHSGDGITLIKASGLEADE